MKNLLIIMAMAFLVGAQCNAQSDNKKTDKMKVAVWDTYVTKKDGKVMHFDILAPDNIKDTTVIYNYGKEYLKSKGQDGQSLTSKECRFCHVERLRPNWEEAINKQGYFIIEMENCN
jgi:Domain of unknown function (DUF2024)